MKINGEIVNANQFAFDGCHKIYLLDSDDARNIMLECGYSEDDFYSISDLPLKWKQACGCGLQFIYSADLKRVYVRQGEEKPVIFSE